MCSGTMHGTAIMERPNLLGNKVRKVSNVHQLEKGHHRRKINKNNQITWKREMKVEFG